MTRKNSEGPKRYTEREWRRLMDAPPTRWEEVKRALAHVIAFGGLLAMYLVAEGYIRPW